MNTFEPETKNNNPFLYKAVLPGPDRKRTDKRYKYRLLYKSAEMANPGCLMIWEVRGGRAPYQIAIERTETGEVRSHCTCADAVYRGDRPNHVCKHVRGFLQMSQQKKRRKPKQPAKI